MSKENNPSPPKHIVFGEQGAVGIQADIREAISTLRHGSIPPRETISSIAETSAFIRIVSLGVLARTGELGAKEATEVAVDLETIDADDYPLAADLSVVASHYSDQREATDDINAQRKYKSLEVFAQAAFGLAAVQTVRLMEGPDAPNTKRLLPYAEKQLMMAAAELSPESHLALTLVFQECQSRS